MAWRIVLSQGLRHCHLSMCGSGIYFIANLTFYILNMPTVIFQDLETKPWPLEEWVFHARISDSFTVYEGFGLRGLKLQGAAVSKGRKLLLTTCGKMTDLPGIRLRLAHIEDDQEADASSVTLPVYLNANRNEILFTVELKVANPEEKLSLHERGLALIASHLQ